LQPKAKSRKPKAKTMSDDDDSILAARNGLSRKKAAVTAQKFTKATKAYKHLEQLFKEKSIQPTDKPSDVRMKDPLFQDFTNQQFRSQFNKLKAIFGTCTKEGRFTLDYYYENVHHATFARTNSCYC
jgi:hypothetical protein